MKIIVWNLKNIGFRKLNNKFSPSFRAYGLGNNVREYITKVVLGNVIWDNTTSSKAADVFVMIELKSGGKIKGNPATGTALLALPAIVADLNAAVATKGIQATHNYNFVVPKVIGYHECVGVIYNDKVLQNALDDSGILKNTSGKNINPRTPYWVRFTEVNAPNTPLNIVGIHAPPPGSGSNNYRGPISFANQLYDVQKINQVNPTINERICLLGDFNCSPGVFYTSKKRSASGAGPFNTPIYPFTQLINTAEYITQLPPLPVAPSPPAAFPVNTLSSIRKKIVSTNPQPTDYLNEPYDNILYKLPGVGGGIRTNVLDLIGNARNVSVNPAMPLYPNNVKATSNNYWKVSDHLPVVLEY
jgi:hypothetical protein